MRNIEKAINEYREKYGANDVFYSGDLKQIYDLSRDPDFSEWLYNAISNALEAGYMIGYKKAQRDYRKRQRAKIS